jgi:hypothetical protein
MSDPNYAHSFDSNAKGRCKRIIGSRICGGTEAAIQHVRAALLELDKAMSRTPQEKVQHWLDQGFIDPELREAIQAVLADYRAEREQTDVQARARRLAEAERSELLATIEQQGVILKAQRARTERAESMLAALKIILDS